MMNIFLLFSFLTYNIKIRMTQPLEFLLEIIITILSDIVHVFLLLVIISLNRSISGWNGNQSMLLFGYILLSGSVSELFIGDLRYLGSGYIRTGRLDTILIKPMSTIVQLMVGEIKVNQIGSAIMGLVICFIQIYNLKLGVVAVMLLILGIFSAIINLVGISAILASSDFWSKAPLNPLLFIEDFRQLIFYPIDIYPKFIKFILFTWLPFAFTGFIQVAAAIGKYSFMLVVLSYMVCGIIWSIALALWKKGVQKYESTG